MQAVRRLVLAHSHLAALICLAALALRVLVPSGYMIDNAHGRMTITICSGKGPATMTMDMPSVDHSIPDHGKSKDHGKTEMPCAFSSLSAQALGAVDLVLLVLALALVAAMALRTTASIPIDTPSYLRPPLRGPPLFR